MDKDKKAILYQQGSKISAQDFERLFLTQEKRAPVVRKKQVKTSVQSPEEPLSQDYQARFEQLYRTKPNDAESWEKVLRQVRQDGQEQIVLFAEWLDGKDKTVWTNLLVWDLFVTCLTGAENKRDTRIPEILHAIWPYPLAIYEQVGKEQPASRLVQLLTQFTKIVDKPVKVIILSYPVLVPLLAIIGSFSIPGNWGVVYPLVIFCYIAGTTIIEHTRQLTSDLRFSTVYQSRSWEWGHLTAFFLYFMLILFLSVIGFFSGSVPAFWICAGLICLISPLQLAYRRYLFQNIAQGLPFFKKSAPLTMDVFYDIFVFGISLVFYIILLVKGGNRGDASLVLGSYLLVCLMSLTAKHQPQDRFYRIDKILRIWMSSFVLASFGSLWKGVTLYGLKSWVLMLFAIFMSLRLARFILRKIPIKKGA